MWIFFSQWEFQNANIYPEAPGRNTIKNAETSITEIDTQQQAPHSFRKQNDIMTDTFYQMNRKRVHTPSGWHCLKCDDLNAHIVISSVLVGWFFFSFPLLFALLCVSQQTNSQMTSNVEK